MKKNALLAFVLVLLSTAVVVRFIRPVVAQGTIYIRADGNVDPPTALIQRDGNVYTFTENIYDEIIVERDDIVVDGAGYTLQGTGSGYGIHLSGRSNIELKNMEIKSFRRGINLSNSSNNNIHGNKITANHHAGIYLFNSSNNIISGNKIMANNEDGIWLFWSSNNTVSGNNIINNGLSGIHLYWDSSDNAINANNMTNNDFCGIWLSVSSRNTVSKNEITDNERGIHFYASSRNTISGNNIRENQYGVHLIRHVEDPTLESRDNKIFHNNFIRNTHQVYSDGSVNVWDDDYPSGGNYWSDYTDEDQNGDGIGDVSYVIDENNQDNYPLMSPWIPAEEGEEKAPFWMQWWFWATVAIVIVALAGGAYFLKKKKPPTPIH